MRYPKTKHGFLAQAPSSRKGLQRIFRPTLGLHAGDTPQDLPAGFTPEARNFVTDQGAITPRSGLSYFAVDFGEPVLGAEELLDSQGGGFVVAASDNSLLFYHSSNDSWSHLSYLPASTITVSDPPSGLSNQYWQFTQIYDDAISEYLGIASNGTNFVKFFEIGASQTTFSDYTWIYNIGEARSAAAIGVLADRVVLFNSISSAGTKYPTRVFWSARGLPRDFTQANGAGYEDLVDMKGEGTALVRLGDSLVLFTDREIWLGRPTLDDYAFRFDRISDKLGCPFPKTAVATPFGVLFLSRDLDVYVATQGGVQPISKLEDGTSRIAPYLEDGLINASRAWAAYNAMKRRYELYYAYEDSTNGFPNRALYYSIDDQSWMPQRFNHELSVGCDMKDPGTLTTWDDLTVTWDSYDRGWDSVTAGDERRDVLAFGSGGTAYRLLSAQTSDDGTAIDARWRSHGLSNGMGQIHLSELWMDYSNGSASSASVFVTNDNGVTFDSGTALSLLSTRRNVFAPLWTTGQAPQFELRVADGGQPKINRMQASLIDAGKFYGT
jgi:hypothetical protein